MQILYKTIVKLSYSCYILIIVIIIIIINVLLFLYFMRHAANLILWTSL